MVEYLAEVRRMKMFFDEFEVWYVPRLDNCDADHVGMIIQIQVLGTRRVRVQG
jgi:hypothetical protein